MHNPKMCGYGYFNPKDKIMKEWYKSSDAQSMENPEQDSIGLRNIQKQPFAGEHADQDFADQGTAEPEIQTENLITNNPVQTLYKHHH